ncbi:hypothetical protein BWP39_19650 [Paraburkholderia acidicola]|uniref:FkbM family methyltransferase n=1 Tax=Paraburkholderia acidicola TaxID=1912599 RepID=A0A2A4EN78_9BURK|nr:FkbM family methyltransferase [Paraburkholderia acidicola]PCE21888.1 hypothetical protein BWP39_19650 [Paraburkholderia acidicola]
MSITSYAQNFEDVMLWRALGAIKNGVYIDVGAQHPTIDSVSKVFYEHGWRGVHIEPTSAYADLLRRDRPDEIVLQVALSNTSGALSLHVMPETGLSTADDVIAEQHRKHGLTMHTITVPCITLADVFKQIGEHDVHWLKIDVEGFERQVVEGWAQHPARPWIVVIESTLPLTTLESHRDWEDLVLSYGYESVYFDGLNRYYLSVQHPELRAAFRVAPNLFDEFELNGTANAPFTRLIERRHRSELQQIRSSNEEAKQTAYLEYKRAKQSTASREAYLVQQEITLNQQLRSAQATIDEIKAERDQTLLAVQEEFERTAQTFQTREQSILQREQALSEQLDDVKRSLHTLEQDHVKQGHEHAERERALIAERTLAIDALTAQLLAAQQELLTLSQDRVARERVLNQHIQRLGDETVTLMRAVVQREREFSRDHAEALKLAEAASNERTLQHTNQLVAQRDDAARREQSLQEEIRALHERLTQAHAVLAAREAAHLAQTQEGLAHAQQLAEHEYQLQIALQEQRTAHVATEHQLAETRRRVELEQAAQDALRVDFAAQVAYAAAVEGEIAWMRQTLTWRLTTPLRRLRGAVPKAARIASPSPVTQPARTEAALDVAIEAVTPSTVAPPSTPDALPTAPLIFGHIGLEHAMTTIKHVDDLLDLHDVAFIEATYRVLLMREPDVEGMRYYLRRLRSGHGKAKALAQIAASAEARSRQRELPGLRDLIDRQRRVEHWFWGFFSRGQRIEQQLNRLENELGRFSRYPTHIKPQPDVEEDRETDAESQAQGLPDLSGLSLSAKRIYADLSRATTNLTKKEAL